VGAAADELALVQLSPIYAQFSDNQPVNGSLAGYTTDEGTSYLYYFGTAYVSAPVLRDLTRVPMLTRAIQG
jgi:hypothetical protein